jgi:hypothetical protein
VSYLRESSLVAASREKPKQLTGDGLDSHLFSRQQREPIFKIAANLPAKTRESSHSSPIDAGVAVLEDVVQKV